MRSLFQSVGQLSLNATLEGPASEPRLSLSSSLDQALSGRLNALLGEQFAAAQARIRDRVTGLAEEQQDALGDQIGQASSRVDASLADDLQKANALEDQLSAYRKQLEDRLGDDARERLEEKRRELERRLPGSLPF